MARTIEWVKRPAPTADYRAKSTPAAIGPLIGLVGVMAVLVATIGNFVAASDRADDPASSAETLAWTFGVNTTGFGLLKLGIAVILFGIIVRLWFRVDSVKAALSKLKPSQASAAGPAEGDISTPYGKATATTRALKPLTIHNLSKALWLPMIAMGAMAVIVALILSFVTAGEQAGTTGFFEVFAWTQGLMFFGEAMLLSGISFLLGAILAGLREGGGEVQESLGVTVKTLKMPLSVKVFIGLMALGMMMGILQFILYIVVASSVETAQSFQAWFAWLGPFREASLGVLLTGITLALYAISRVLGFQFTRIREIISTGA